MKDIVKQVKSRKSKTDIIEKDGRLFYMEEDMTEEKPLEELFKPFVGDFVDLSITNKIENEGFEDKIK